MIFNGSIVFHLYFYYKTPNEIFKISHASRVKIMECKVSDTYRNKNVLISEVA